MITSLLLAAASGAAEAANDVYLIWGVVAFVVAVGLVILELFVPSGGLIGLVAGVALIVSLVCFFKYDSTVGAFTLLGYLILIPVGGWFGFKLWLMSPLARRMILTTNDETTADTPEEAAIASEQARAERVAQLRQLIGVEGVTVTALRPVGTIKIEGRRLDALAETGIIEADVPVIVSDVYDNQVKVRPKS